MTHQAFPAALVSFLNLSARSVARQMTVSLVLIQARHRGETMLAASGGDSIDPAIAQRACASDLDFAIQDPVAVMEGNARYACARLALKGPRGDDFGSVCLFDVMPRHLDATGTAHLQDLADAIAMHLDLYESAESLRLERDYYRMAVELSPQISWAASPAGLTTEMSPRWLALMGMSREEHLGMGWGNALHPADREEVLHRWWGAVGSGDHFNVDYRLRLADGSYRWFHGYAAPQRDDDGQIVLWFGTDEDIHDRKIAEMALQESERRLRFALDVGRLGDWEIDITTHRLTSSDRTAANFGLSPTELTYEKMLTTIHIDDRERRRANFDRAVETGQTYEIEYRIIWPDQSLHWIKATGRAMMDEDGKPLKMVGLSVDNTKERVSETARKAAEARMVHLAHHDALTGVANRRLFNDELTKALRSASVDQGVVVFCIDLDNFKGVNDVLGHEAGDIVLRQTAERLTQAVGTGGLVARYGGDEFAVLLSGVTSDADVEALAIRLSQVIGEPRILGDRTILVQGSIGIANAPRDGLTANELQRNADTALYRAKTTGRGSYRFFEQEMDRQLQQRQALTLSLQTALERHEFRVVYQPIVSLATNSASSFEALLRWHHPVRGDIAPSEFIPIAEEMGWIAAIGKWVLEEACRAASSWPAPVSVSVNLSAAQFDLGNVLGDVAGALALSGLSAARLDLEVTETVLLQETVAHIETLRSLSDLGVKLVLDDFGTGYSSLGYLRRSPFSKIKIDKSLIRDLPDQHEGDVIVRALLGLGRSLGIAVVAEGVETTDQLDFLRLEGCAEVQGYLASAAVPADEVRALIDRSWFAGTIEQSLSGSVAT
jgi:diguanylate cyclase (GGDEF)-like protein/PAS domain S-box-containing protein